MKTKAKTSFKIRDVEFKNRVFTASGTFGYGDEVKDIVDVEQLGGIVTKSLSWNPREGNKPRRIVETASGMLNSIGLANIGVHSFIKQKLPYLKTLKTAIIANIAASSVKEYCDVLSLLESEEGIAAYEINISCPNVNEGGLTFGTDPAMTRNIVAALRQLTTKPLIIKLTPNVTHISEFARVVTGEGADAISAINTLVGMAVDVKTRKPKLSTTTGGLSGPAIKPVALAKVYEIAQAVNIPIFAIGGIGSVEDALEFLIVGAAAVQIGTMNFIDPSISTAIVSGLGEYLEREGIDDIQKLIGTLIVDKERSVIASWL
jgi:dihydroorotate dehydrogenase (NAD+) catalytic subunit